MDAGQRRQGGRVVGHLGGELAGASERSPRLRCARAEQLAEQVAEPHLHPELTAGALGRGRHGPEQLQRPAELLLGLLEGQPGHRQVGRGEHPRQRRVGAGHRHRGPGMPGDLQHVLGVVAVQARQGLADPGVEPHPAGLADVLVDRLANQPVSEPVSPHRLVVLDDQSGHHGRLRRLQARSSSSPATASTRSRSKSRPAMAPTSRMALVCSGSRASRRCSTSRTPAGIARRAAAVALSPANMPSLWSSRSSSLTKNGFPSVRSCTARTSGSAAGVPMMAAMMLATSALPSPRA